MLSIRGSGAWMRVVSGFWRMSSANGSGQSHMPGGVICAPFSSNFSAPGIMAAITGEAFLRATNQATAIFLSFKSFCCSAEKTRVEPT